MSDFNPLDYGFVYNNSCQADIIVTESYLYLIKLKYGIWFISCYRSPDIFYEKSFDFENSEYSEIIFFNVIKKEKILNELESYVNSYKRKSTINEILLELS